MMSDPAVEAAQRAGEIDPFPELDAAGLGYVKRLLTEAAAREMAKSVQGLHKPEPGPLIHDDTPWTCCADCGDETANAEYLELVGRTISEEYVPVYNALKAMRGSEER